MIIMTDYSFTALQYPHLAKTMATALGKIDIDEEVYGGEDIVDILQGMMLDPDRITQANIDRVKDVLPVKFFFFPRIIFIHF